MAAVRYVENNPEVAGLLKQARSGADPACKVMRKHANSWRSPKPHRCPWRDGGCDAMA